MAIQFVQGAKFDGFFEQSKVFEQLKEKVRGELRQGQPVAEEVFAATLLLVAESVVKHNLNSTHIGRFDLLLFVDSDNSPTVRKVFKSVTGSPNDSQRARETHFHMRHYSLMCAAVMRDGELFHKLDICRDLKAEFLAYSA